MTIAGLIPKSHCPYIAWQILLAIGTIHHKRIIHLRLNSKHILLDK